MSAFRDYEGNIDIGMVVLAIMMVGLIISLFTMLIYLFIDGTYVRPIADSNANNYCKSLGFDQYKSYSRVGIWSEDPIGIKCEYAEKYTDLGVRSNVQ